MGGQAGAARDFDKVMKASKWFIFQAEQEFSLCRSAEGILKYPLMLTENNAGLGERSGTFSVFAPYPGHFVIKQSPACCAMQLLAEVQVHEAGLPSQSITELLALVPGWWTCRNMGRKGLGWRGAGVSIEFLQVSCICPNIEVSKSRIILTLRDLSLKVVSWFL